MNAASLRESNCRDAVSALSGAELAPLLAALPDWQLVDGALQRRFEFPDYYHTVGFVNALAWLAHSHNHHPELLVRYDSCTVRYRTHSVNAGAGGISLNDAICAARADALVTHKADA